MLTRMQQRRGTLAEWNDPVIAASVILQAGEVGLETDTGRFKIGNGTSVWQSLPYYLPDNNPSNVTIRQGKNLHDVYAKLSPLAESYSQTFTGSQVLVPNAADRTPLVVAGAAGQTGILQLWRTSAGATLASMDHTGKLTASGGGMFSGEVNVNNNRITNVATPTGDNDAVSKIYVDSAIAGLAWKEAVHLIAHGAGTNVALTGTTGTLVIDGHDPLVQADSGEYRLLLTGQTTASENGIYLYTDDGTNYTLTRTTDADAPEELKGSSVYVQEGTTYGTSSWVQSNYEIDSFDDQTWVQFSGAALINAGLGMTKDGNTLDVNGTADRITANADSIDIASTYVGQASITTLGNVTTGTWSADVVDETKGGTGQSSYTVGDVLYADTTTSLAKLSPGTASYALLSGGSGVAPSYGQVPTAGIANDAVTYDKLQNVSGQYRVLGRIETGAGNAEELTPDQLMETINQGITDISFNLLPVGTTSTTVAQGDHTHTLDQLSDVEIGTPALRQVLKYDGTKWINELPSGGISIGATPPVDASSGDAWFDSTDGSLYVYYDDGIGLGYQEDGSDTETVSHGSGYSTTLLVSWSHDEANSRYVVNYTYSLRATTSFFTTQSLLGQLVVNGNVVWTPSGTYSISLNQTIVLAQSSTFLPYAPSTDLSMTVSGTVRTTNQGANLLPQATVTVGPEVLVDVAPFTSSAQWVQVKANSALEASILTRVSALEARSTDIEAANAVRVANEAERNSVYPAPVQGNTVFRADLGYEEKYYAAYNATTNPDGTRGTAGWYRYAGSAPLSENVLINSAFDIWQRGTSISNPANGTYTADRWQVRQDGSGFASVVSRVSLTPSESQSLGLDYALRYQVTNAGTSNTFRQIGNVVENVSTLSGKTIAVSYWAKTNSGSATISPNLRQYFGAGGSSQTFTGGTTATLTSTWTKYFSTINVPSIDGKTIDSGSFIQLLFILPGNAAFDVSITGVQVEEGPVPTPFRRNQENIQAELAACQRYYWHGGAGGLGRWSSSTTAEILVKFPVTMRTAPSVTFVNNFEMSNVGVSGSTGTSASLSGANRSVDACFVNVTATNGTTGNFAGIYGNGIGFSAEL